MNHTELDKEYYVMDVHGANNHPTLEWGEVDDSPFLEDSPIDISELNFPINVVFDEPYLSKYIMPDFLMLGLTFACTDKVKNIFEKQNIYGIEFFPIETITDNKGETIKGYYAIHIWNKLIAIDKKNYIGEEMNNRGYIFDLEKFSLDEDVLKNIPLKERLVFNLKETPSMTMVHHSIYEIIKLNELSGFTFFRVDDWDDDAFFR